MFFIKTNLFLIYLKNIVYTDVTACLVLSRVACTSPVKMCTQIENAYNFLRVSSRKIEYKATRDTNFSEFELSSNVGKQIIFNCITMAMSRSIKLHHRKHIPENAGFFPTSFILICLASRAWPNGVYRRKTIPFLEKTALHSPWRYVYLTFGIHVCWLLTLTHIHIHK